MISHEELQRILDYDRETGHFTWKISAKAITIGAIAGHIKTDDGYIRIKIQGKRYYAHILAWFYITGAWPVGKLDHRNTYRGDNRFENLREGTSSQNSGNRKTDFDNKLGIKGVTEEPSGRFRAKICKDGKIYSLGCFATKDQAAEAYRIKSEELFGEFSFPHRT